MRSLERRYRWLLSAYPAECREEIVGTLLDLAPPTQRMPRPGEVLDLVVHGLQARLHPTVRKGLLTGSAQAAPIALALAAGISLYLWWRVEPHVGTLGPIAYGAWLLTLIGWIVPRAPIRTFVAYAVSLTLAVIPLSGLTPLDRPPLWVVAVLTMLGFIALSGVDSHERDGELRWLPLAGAVAVAVVADVTGRLLPAGKPEWTPYYYPAITAVGCAVAGVIAWQCFRWSAVKPEECSAAESRKGEQPVATESAMWTILVLAVPSAWLGPIDVVAFHFDQAGMPRFGRLAYVVLATSVLVGLICARSGVRGSSRLAGSAALGCALGYGGFAWYAGTSMTPFVWVTLATLAVLAWGRAGLPATAIAAVFCFVCAWAIGIYVNDWSVTGWTDADQAVQVASSLAIVPCVMCAFQTAEARSPFILILAVGWIGLVTAPYALAWGPILLGLILWCGSWIFRAARPKNSDRSEYDDRHTRKIDRGC